MEKLPEEENSIISKNLRADPRPLPPPPSGLPPSWCMNIEFENIVVKAKGNINLS